MDRIGVNIYELSVQDGLVALRSKINSDFPTKQDEGEDIAILGKQS